MLDLAEGVLLEFSEAQLRAPARFVWALLGGLVLSCSSRPVVQAVEEVPKEIVPKEIASTTSAEPVPAATPVLIARYETRYVAGSPRGHNIELATSLLYFVPIKPGASFSFNQQVGPRDRAHGFWLAPVIVDGELTDGEGGGVCQVSSTLHAAARLARLVVEERSPHTRPSDYIALGLDATVAYPSKDLKLRNDGTSSVILALYAQHGVLTAEVLGESLGTATYSFKVGSTGQSFGGHTKAGCPSKLVQKGVGGRIVWSTLTSDDGGKTTWRSVYPPTDEVWQVCPTSLEVP